LQERSITCEDGIFGVFDVKVLSHVLLIKSRKKERGD